MYTTDVAEHQTKSSVYNDIVCWTVHSTDYIWSCCSLQHRLHLKLLNNLQHGLHLKLLNSLQHRLHLKLLNSYNTYCIWSCWTVQNLQLSFNWQIDLKVSIHTEAQSATHQNYLTIHNNYKGKFTRICLKLPLNSASKAQFEQYLL